MSDTEQQENLVIELQTFDSCYEAEGPRILLDNKIVNSHSRLTNQIKTYISRDVDTKLAGITSLQVFQEIFFSQDEQGETFLHFCAKKNASKCCRIFLEFEEQYKDKLKHKLKSFNNSRKIEYKRQIKSILEISNDDGILPIHYAAAFTKTQGSYTLGCRRTGQRFPIKGHRKPSNLRCYLTQFTLIRPDEPQK